MMFTVIGHAEPDTRFDVDAFVSQVGKVVPVRFPGHPDMLGEIIRVDVAPGGKSYTLTVEVAA